MTSVGPKTPSGIFCRHCGYDLRTQSAASTPRCPECGRPFSPTNPKTFRPHPFAAPWKRALGRWAKRTAILLLALTLLLGGTWLWLYWGWKQEHAALARIMPLDLNALYYEAGDYTVRPLGYQWAPSLQKWCGPAGFVLDRITVVQVPITTTDADLAHLGELRRLHHLEFLEIKGRTITEAGLIHLRELHDHPTLSWLDFNTRIPTDASLAHLGRLPQLTRLELDASAVTGTGFVHPDNFPQLQDLRLKESQVTDAGLTHLAQLKHLQNLSLDYTHVTDAGLLHLTKLKELQDLDLSATRVTDAGLAHLAQIPSLATLNLYGTPVTDAGLEHLAKCPHLRTLTIYETHVTPAGVARLKAALPHCEIDGP